MRARSLIAAVVVLFGICAPDGAAEEIPPNATVVRNLDIVAFGNEYTGKRYDAVRKWATPIVARIDGPAPDRFEDDVAQHLADLQKISGHPAALVYSPRILREKRVPKGLTAKSFNLFLLYYPIDELTAVARKQLGNKMDESLERLRLGRSTCEATYYTKDSAIVSAVVLFPAERPPHHMRACVVEELAQIMGLPNDSTHVAPSIFNDKSRYTELTAHDRLLLRVLYDKRIVPGMPREAALKAARTILDELRPGK